MNVLVGLETETWLNSGAAGIGAAFGRSRCAFLACAVRIRDAIEATGADRASSSSVAMLSPVVEVVWLCGFTLIARRSTFAVEV